MKNIIIPTLIAVGLIGGTIALTRVSTSVTDDGIPPVDAVRVENGVQIIDLRAKGGFTPRRTSASAGIPTTIRFNTKSTFDCSASVRIPSLNVSKLLPATGVTDIAIGTPSPGLLKGTCGMGMYPFEIEFTN